MGFSNFRGYSKISTEGDGAQGTNIVPLEEPFTGSLLDSFPESPFVSFPIDSYLLIILVSDAEVSARAAAAVQETECFSTQCTQFW